MKQLSVSADIALAFVKSGVECHQIRKEDAIKAIRSDLARDYPELRLDESNLTVYAVDEH